MRERGSYEAAFRVLPRRVKERGDDSDESRMTRRPLCMDLNLQAGQCALQRDD